MKSIYHLAIICILAFTSLHCSRKNEIYAISKRKISVNPKFRTIIQDHNREIRFVSHRRLDTLNLTPVIFLDTVILADCMSIQHFEDSDEFSYLTQTGSELCTTEVVFLSSTIKNAKLVWDTANEETTIFKNINYSQFIDVTDTFKNAFNIDPEFKSMNWRIYYPSKSNYYSYFDKYTSYFNSDSIEYFILGNYETFIGFKYLQDTTVYMRITK